MRRICTVVVAIGFLLIFAFGFPVHAQQEKSDSKSTTSSETQSDAEAGTVEKLEDIVVTGKGGLQGVDIKPGKTTIQVDDYSAIGDKNNIQDLLKTQAIFDFRGETDLVPDSDTLHMRGFNSERFVMAVDGLTVEKSGGRNGSHIVDYSLLSSLPIEKIEITAGPHSAMYSGKSIGGTVNVVTRAPHRRDSLVPDVRLSTSYSSYNTQNHKLNLNGAVDMVTYSLDAQKNTTDGYLRHNETDIQTFSGSLGLLLPYEGYVTASGSQSDIDRECSVTNTGDDYDSSYPEVTAASFEPWQTPTWDKEAWSYKLNYLQNLPIGRLTLDAYKSKENRHRDYDTWVNKNDRSLGTYRYLWETNWRQKGGRLQDIYMWSESHETTIGFDMVKMYDGGDDLDERINKKGGYLQHRWNITPYLDTKLGLRYEDVKIWVSNAGITGMGDWIERDWDQWVPKSYTTWKMDPMADWLRDTSLSLGVSKIWHAPDYHGQYNPQGRPAGAWLDPEHGMGYDLVLNRRLWRDVALMVDYSFYQIEDYIVNNRSYAEYTPPPGGFQDEEKEKIGKEYSDYKINLEEVYRHGVELSLGGHLFEDLSFYVSYAWQKFDNQGNEPAGVTELDDEAEHRVNAGLRYQIFEKTALKLDYYYQSEESQEQSEEIGQDGNGDPIYRYWEVDNAAYNLFHFAVEQTLLQEKWHIKDARLQFFIKNLFDEEYYDARGYPATDRTFGVNLSFRI